MFSDLKVNDAYELSGLTKVFLTRIALGHKNEPRWEKTRSFYTQLLIDTGTKYTRSPPRIAHQRENSKLQLLGADGGHPQQRLPLLPSLEFLGTWNLTRSFFSCSRTVAALTSPL